MSLLTDWESNMFKSHFSGSLSDPRAVTIMGTLKESSPIPFKYILAAIVTLSTVQSDVLLSRYSRDPPNDFTSWNWTNSALLIQWRGVPSTHEWSNPSPIIPQRWHTAQLVSLTAQIWGNGTSGWMFITQPNFAGMVLQDEHLFHSTSFCLMGRSVEKHRF